MHCEWSIQALGSYFRASCLIAIVAFNVSLLSYIFAHPLFIGWDPALHLQCAQLIVKGGLPYVDMLDVNPPLIWYIDCLPALASKWFAIPVTMAFNLFVCLLIDLAALYMVRLCRVAIRRESASARALFGIFCGYLFFNLFLRFDFGQREEIFALLFVPYIFLRWLRYKGWRPGLLESLAVGIAGGIGVSMKHYYVIQLVACEFLLLAMHARPSISGLVKNKRNFLSPELFGLIGFGLVYALHFLFLPQTVRDSYFGFLLPAFAQGYNFWDTCLAYCLASPDHRGVFVLGTVAATLLFALNRRAEQKNAGNIDLLALISTFAFTGVIPYLMQFKGWAYQDIPFFAGAAMLAGMTVTLSLTLLWRLSSAFLCLGLSALSFCYFSWSAYTDLDQVRHDPPFDMNQVGYRGSCSKWDVNTPFTEIILKHSKVDDPILFISNAVTPAYPILTQLKRQPSSRHLHCCILSVLQYIQEARESTSANLKLLDHRPKIVQQYESDIQIKKPALIFLQNMPVEGYMQPYGFEDFLAKDYRILEADVANFKVYVRKQEAGH